MAKIGCPRCEQDWLQVVRLVNIGKEGVLCLECEAFWSEGTEPLYENFVSVTAYLKSHGRDVMALIQSHGRDYRYADEFDFLGPLWMP